MAFRGYERPGDVLTEDVPLDQKSKILNEWREMTRRELDSDGEGMAPASTSTVGEEHRRVETGLALLALAERAEKESS